MVKRWVRRWTRRRAVHPRQLIFTGMVNFRDLGGLPADGGTVKRGVLYRSDSLAYATPGDAKRLVDQLRLTTIIDLRGQYEVENLGRGPLVDMAVTYVHAPIVDVSGADDLAGHYLAMLAEKGDVLAGMIKLLAAAETLPAVFHCEAGCDRTGVLAAAVLGLLGRARGRDRRGLRADRAGHAGHPRPGPTASPSSSACPPVPASTWSGRPRRR